MIKEELIERVAAAHHLPKSTVRAIMRTLLQTVTEAVAAGDRVVLIGFGSFEAPRAAARVGRNPRTGERVTIHAGRRPRFLAGRRFRDAVRDRHLPPSDSTANDRVVQRRDVLPLGGLR
jgi:DNA-binding protein HU-beta